MTTYRLGSSPAIHTPGIVNWAQQGYKEDPGFFKNLLVAAFPTVPPEALTALLRQEVLQRLDGETVVFDAYVKTEPQAETSEEYWDALECMPPSRFQHTDGVELFHICEHLTGNLVNWHAKIGDKHFQFNDAANANSVYLAGLVRNAA